MTILPGERVQSTHVHGVILGQDTSTRRRGELYASHPTPRWHFQV